MLIIKIAFNTVDNLIRKPQPTNTVRRSDEKKRSPMERQIIEPCSGLQFISSMEMPRLLFRRTSRTEKLSLCLRGLLGQRLPVWLWLCKGRSNKRLRCTSIYQTNTLQHRGTYHKSPEFFSLAAFCCTISSRSAATIQFFYKFTVYRNVSLSFTVLFFSLRLNK